MTVELFMLAVLLLFAGFAIGEVWLLVKWRGSWRIAAAVPGVLFCAIVAKMFIDILANPTSHNLWPFEIIIWSGAGLVILGVLVLIRLTRPGEAV